MHGRRDGRHVLFNALLGLEAWFSTRPLSAALISLNPRVVDLRIVGRLTVTDAPVNASCWWKRVPVSIASSRIDDVRRIFLSFPTETTTSLTRSALSVNARSQKQHPWSFGRSGHQRRDCSFDGSCRGAFSRRVCCHGPAVRSRQANLLSYGSRL
jgi:hypothetical protein